MRAYAEIIGAVIPELLPMVGYDQKNYHHIYDLYEHTVLTVERCPKRPDLRMAALLHDIGKPETRSTDSSGIAHYWGHESKSAEMAGPILRRLRYSNFDSERISTLIRHHWTDILESEPSVRRAIRDFGPELYFELVQLMKADNSSKAPQFVVPSYYDRLSEIGKSVISRGLCCTLKELAVDGNDLIAAGYRPGVRIRKTLDLLLEAVIDGRVNNTKDELMGYLPVIEEES